MVKIFRDYLVPYKNCPRRLYFPLLIEDDKAKLQLKKNQSGILVCRRQIQRNNPIYIPPNNEFAEKLVMNVHLKTLHEGVASKMTNIRGKYWIPRLCQLVKALEKDVMVQKFSKSGFKYQQMDYYQVTELKVAELSKLLVLTMLNALFIKRNKNRCQSIHFAACMHSFKSSSH